MKLTLHFASDHAAVDLRCTLQQAAEGWGFVVVDHGPATTDSIDYPLQATKIAHALADDGQALGVLVCGTGIGMSMVANRFSHLRAAAVSDTFSAAATRQHNDANVLCIGARTVGPGLAEDLLKTFVETAFEGGRHSRRVALFPPGFEIEE